jgi:hypothetical protein
MNLRIYSLILTIILISSLTSIFLLLYYMNPETDLSFSFALMSLAVILAGSSILAFLIFFIKKIYYRGEVYVATMHASVRQATLIMLACIGTLGLYSYYGSLQPKLVLTFCMVMMIIEIMAQSLD